MCSLCHRRRANLPTCRTSPEHHALNATSRVHPIQSLACGQSCRRHIHGRLPRGEEGLLELDCKRLAGADAIHDAGLTVGSNCVVDSLVREHGRVLRVRVERAQAKLIGCVAPCFRVARREQKTQHPAPVGCGFGFPHGRELGCTALGSTRRLLAFLPVWEIGDSSEETRALPSECLGGVLRSGQGSSQKGVIPTNNRKRSEAKSSHFQQTERKRKGGRCSE